MHPFAGNGVQVGRQRCHQRFAFTGAHLGNATRVQHHAADQLDIKVTQAERPARRFTGRGKRFRQQRIQALAFFQPLFELLGFVA